jgi:hypothetical protein
MLEQKLEMVTEQWLLQAKYPYQGSTAHHACSLFQAPETNTMMGRTKQHNSTHL